MNVCTYSTQKLLPSTTTSTIPIYYHADCEQTSHLEMLPKLKCKICKTSAIDSQDGWSPYSILYSLTRSFAQEDPLHNFEHNANLWLWIGDCRPLDSNSYANWHWWDGNGMGCKMGWERVTIISSIKIIHIVHVHVDQQKWRKEAASFKIYQIINCGTETQFMTVKLFIIATKTSRNKRQAAEDMSWVHAKMCRKICSFAEWVALSGWRSLSLYSSAAADRASRTSQQQLYHHKANLQFVEPSTTTTTTRVECNEILEICIK